jgi:hypothetical protein
MATTLEAHCELAVAKFDDRLGHEWSEPVLEKHVGNSFLWFWSCTVPTADYMALAFMLQGGRERGRQWTVSKVT